MISRPSEDRTKYRQDDMARDDPCRKIQQANRQCDRPSAADQAAGFCEHMHPRENYQIVKRSAKAEHDSRTDQAHDTYGWASSDSTKQNDRKEEP